MALNSITFFPGTNGLGRPLIGQDHISGLIFYSSTLPAGFDSSNRIKKIFSVQQAEALGIVSDFSDETKATGSVTVTAVGANGDTIVITFTEPDGTVVTLGSYTKVSGDTTVTLVATAIKNAINALTISHGYTATSAVGAVTITARAGLGIFPNSGTPLAQTIVGTLAATLVQMSAGAYSKMANFNYHIAEFFRIQPAGVLYVGIFAVPGTYTFTEVETMRNFADGTIRQLGVYKDGAAFATANITTLQALGATCLTLKTPMSILYAADLVAVTDLGTLTDLSTLNAHHVSAVISQDGAGLGFKLFKATGRSITTLGATLGAIARAKVSESISWVAKFNMSNGVELDTIAFANGTQYKDLALAAITSLNDYRYIFLRKFDNYSASIHTAAHCATTYASDYSFIENNRTIGKAIRGVNASLIPELGGPLTLKADGTLLSTTVVHFEDAMEPNLDAMVRDGEISAYSRSIDPTQDVLTTSTLEVSVAILPKGVANFINVNIQFVKQL